MSAHELAQTNLKGSIFPMTTKLFRLTGVFAVIAAIVAFLSNSTTIISSISPYLPSLRQRNPFFEISRYFGVKDFKVVAQPNDTTKVIEYYILSNIEFTIVTNTGDSFALSGVEAKDDDVTLDMSKVRMLADYKKGEPLQFDIIKKTKAPALISDALNAKGARTQNEIDKILSDYNYDIYGDKSDTPPKWGINCYATTEKFGVYEPVQRYRYRFSELDITFRDSALNMTCLVGSMPQRDEFRRD